MAGKGTGVILVASGLMLAAGGITGNLATMLAALFAPGALAPGPRTGSKIVGKLPGGTVTNPPDEQYIAKLLNKLASDL